MKPIECAMLMLQMGTHKLILLFYYNKCKSIFFIFLHLTFTIRFLRNRKIIKIKQTVWVLYGCFFFSTGITHFLANILRTPDESDVGFLVPRGVLAVLKKFKRFSRILRLAKPFATDLLQSRLSLFWGPLVWCIRCFSSSGCFLVGV